MDDLLCIAVSNAVAATVLALMAIGVTAVYRRPALAHGLWLLVLLKLVTPPLLFLPITWPASAESPVQEVSSIPEEHTDLSRPGAEERAVLMVVPQVGDEQAAGVEAPPTVEEPQPSALSATEPSLWPKLLRIVWGVGALAWFLLALERLHHFRRLLRFSRHASAALQERTRRLSRSLGLRRCPRVRLLPGRIAPMLWAVGGPPRLLVPAALLTVLSDDQLDTLLLHELAHLRRRDHWVRILEFVVMGLYWWHPVVWYARRELREAEEQCCDAWVVSTLPGAGRTYASALLDTLDFLSTAQAAVPPLASGLGQIADLKRRLTMIMRANTPRSLTWPGCFAVIALGLTFLPMLPALHGQAPSKEEASKSVEEAAKDLERAKAELEYEKARLERQKADVDRAEKQLRKAAAARDYQQTIQSAKLRRQATMALNMIGQVRESNPKIRIEILVNDVEGINVSELAKKLKEMFPQKSAHINISTTQERHVGVSPGNAPPSAGFTPAKPLELESPMPPKSPSRGQEKRINDLEQKLEKVLRELQELRKQMKQPRPGASYRPARLMVPAASVPTPPGQPPLAPSPSPDSAPNVPGTPEPAATPPALPRTPVPPNPTPPDDPTRP